MIPLSEASRREALQLALSPPAADGHRSFTLFNHAGETRLQRALPPGGPGDCAALAETAALIVQRFLTELDEPVVESPPPSPPLPLVVRAPAGPERRWDLSLASAWRMGSEVWGALALGARAGRLLSSGRWLVAGGVGLGGEAALAPVGMDYRGTARARQLPVDLGLWWRTPGWRRAELQIGAGGGLDVTRVATRSASGIEDIRWLPGPVVFAATALRVALRGPTFFRLSAGGAGGVVTYRFSYRPESSVDGLTIFTVPTHRFYVRIAADIGFTLR